MSDMSLLSFADLRQRSNLLSTGPPTKRNDYHRIDQSKMDLVVRTLTKGGTWRFPF